MVTLVPRRSKLLLGRSPGRDAPGGRDRALFRLADPGPALPRAVNARAARLAPGRLPLPPAAGHRLLRGGPSFTLAGEPSARDVTHTPAPTAGQTVASQN